MNIVQIGNVGKIGYIWKKENNGETGNIVRIEKIGNIRKITNLSWDLGLADKSQMRDSEPTRDSETND